MGYTKENDKQKEQVDTIIELGRERQFLDVICRDYTSVYYADLKNNYVEPLKVSASANASSMSEIQLRQRVNYVDTINSYGRQFVAESSQQDFLRVMQRENLVLELAAKERFVYRYESVPNKNGQHLFEAQAVRLNVDFFDGRALVAFRYIDDIVTREQEYQCELEKAAFEDALTGTGNRGAFRREMPLYEENHPHVAVMVADVNNLKFCNDRYGHKAGDKMIQDAADCIREAFAGMGKCYRIGGDEFCVLMPEQNAAEIEAALGRLQDQIDQKNQTRNMMLTIACGYAMRQDEKEGMEHIFNRADELMYEKKYSMKKEFPVYCEERIKNYRHVLEILSKSTSSYLFLLDIARDENWFFGDVDRDYDIREPGSPTNTTAQMLAITYPQDRTALMEDLQRIADGKQETHDMNYRWVNRKGEPVWINCRGTVIHDDKGKPFVMIGRVSDELLRHLYQPMTGLFNKTKLLMDLKQSILAESQGSLMFINMDRMGDINLKHGRAYGDQVIIQCARRLERHPEVELIWHVENNCFVLYLKEKNPDRLRDFYDCISEELRDLCSLTAGVVPINADVFEDESNLYTCGEIVLERAKRSGTHAFAIFSQEELNHRIWKVKFTEEMRESIENGCEGFYLCYQPQICTGRYQLYGAEALLRYRSKSQEEVYPDTFIPLLEETRLIHPVGRWVLKTALEQCKKWREKIPDFHISVNFSPVQLKETRVAEDVLDILKASGLPGQALTVEITESTQLEKFQIYHEVFKKWSEAGISLSIDDFGTGYSNMAYLKKLDVDEIKIDRLFVSGLERATYNYRLISNMIDFAKGNDIRICCEGVENDQECQVLEDLSPDLMQGYFFARPCSTEAFEKTFVLGVKDFTK